MDGIKSSKQAVAGDALAQLSGFAPPMLLALGSRVATRSARLNMDTATTNVPGPQLPLHTLDRRLLASYPYVPIVGTIRIVVAIFSYDGELYFGVTGRPGPCPRRRRPHGGHRGRHRQPARRRKLSPGLATPPSLPSATRSGAGIRAAPAMTSPNAIIRPAIATAPVPIESRKTRTPPTIAMRLAATEVSAMTSTPGPICRPRAEA